MAQWVKKSPAMQETQEIWVRFLGREDPLEEGMATHSNILAWRIPWTEEPGGLQRSQSWTRLEQWSRSIGIVTGCAFLPFWKHRKGMESDVDDKFSLSIYH